MIHERLFRFKEMDYSEIIALSNSNNFCLQDYLTEIDKLLMIKMIKEKKTVKFDSTIDTTNKSHTNCKIIPQQHTNSNTIFFIFHYCSTDTSCTVDNTL